MKPVGQAVFLSTNIREMTERSLLWNRLRHLIAIEGMVAPSAKWIFHLLNIQLLFNVQDIPSLQLPINTYFILTLIFFLLGSLWVFKWSTMHCWADLKLRTKERLSFKARLSLFLPQETVSTSSTVPVWTATVLIHVFGEVQGLCLLSGKKSPHFAKEQHSKRLWKAGSCPISSEVWHPYKWHQINNNILGAHSYKPLLDPVIYGPS